MRQVTDPTLIDELNKAPAAPMGGNRPVTDPSILSQLEGPGYLESARRGAAQGLSLGYSDEIVGGAQAVRDYVMDRGSVMDEGIGDIYRRNRDLQRSQNMSAREANPKTYGGAQLAGAIAPAVLATIGTKGAALPAIAGRLGAIGAVEGLGHSEADLTKGEFGGAAVDTAIGGTVGAVMPGAMRGLGKGAKAIGKGVGSLFQGAGKRGLSAATNIPLESIEAYTKRPEAIKAALGRTSTNLAEKELTTSTKILSDRTSKLYDSAMKELSSKKPAFAVSEINRMIGSLQGGLKAKAGAIIGTENKKAFATLARLKDDFAKMIPKKETFKVKGKIPVSASQGPALGIGKLPKGQITSKMVPQPMEKVLTQGDMKRVLSDVRTMIKKWKPKPGEADNPTSLSLKSLQGQINEKLGAANPKFAEKMKPVAEHLDLLKRIEKKFGLEKVGPRGDRTFKAGKTAVQQLEQVPKEKNIESRQLLEKLQAKSGGKSYFRGGEPGAKQGQYFTPDKKYAGKFGSEVSEYGVQPKNVLDLKSLGERAMSPGKLKSSLSQYGISLDDIKDPDFLYDDVSKPAWQWVRKYPELAERIKGKGFDAVSFMETKLGKGPLSESIQVLDEGIVKAGKPAGTDILGLAEDLRLAAPLKSGRVQGSRHVNQYAITGAGVGTLVGGIPGGAIGGVIGQGFGAHVDKFGGQYARRVIDAFRNYQKGNIGNLLEVAPEAFGQWAPILKQAVQRGGNSLITTHYILQQQDPEYRKQLENINTEFQGKTR